MNDIVNMNPTKHPFVLMIIDGFGYSEKKQHNAIATANTPNWDRLWQTCPHLLIDCSGKKVGLPDGQMGNSEVGHMNIGAGRIIYQDLTRIDNAIDQGIESTTSEFFNNPTLLDLLSDHETPLHVIGLVSDGGVHSHLRHYLALAKLAKHQGLTKLYVHAFLDGRDTPPQSALPNLLELDNYLRENNVGKIASIVGRYYAMDRDKRWDRTQLAFDLLTGNFTIDNTNFFQAENIQQAIEAAYSRKETDEFIKPTIINNVHKIQDHHNVLFMNFRADRARQLSHYLTDKSKINLKHFVTLTEYEKNLTKNIIFKPQLFKNVLGEFLESHKLTQLRIAETEKYAHVTFFFNGGIEKPFDGEERILIPSPKVKTYDLKPEMSAYELTEALCEAIESNKYDAIICNYANPDMVGHTGSMAAAVKALQAVDYCLGQVTKSIQIAEGQLFITADHGNAECMYDETTNQPHTAHTQSLVPLVYFNKNPNISNDIKARSSTGSLADIAPSMIYLMGYDAPTDMTGSILFK